MSLEEDIDNASETIIVVCLLLFLGLGEVKLMLADALLNHFVIIELYLKLLMKEFTARSCAKGVLFNDIP
jgi:hypothetical protein